MSVLFLKIKSAQQYVLYKSTAKKIVRKKYGRTALIDRRLSHFRTFVLIFLCFQGNI